MIVGRAITLEREPSKKSKELFQKKVQRGLRVITLQEAIEKSPILLSQYWIFDWFDGTIIISYFGGSNNTFADCTLISPTVSVLLTFYPKAFFAKM